MRVADISSTSPCRCVASPLPFRCTLHKRFCACRLIARRCSICSVLHASLVNLRLLEVMLSASERQLVSLSESSLPASTVTAKAASASSCMRFASHASRLSSTTDCGRDENIALVCSMELFCHGFGKRIVSMFLQVCGATSQDISLDLSTAALRLL
jgi:hypothetical protein